MALGKRVEELRKERRMTQDELARAAGLDPDNGRQTIQAMESRDSKTSQFAANIARALGVSLEYLMTGEGWWDHNKLLKAIENKPENNPGQPPIIITHYATGGLMGDGGLVLKDQPGVIENWSVSREWLRANVPHCSNPANLCIVTGFGDSMLGVFNPGDPVLVDQGVKVCDHDGIYFFRVGNEGFIKRLQRIPGEGIRVISQNPHYRDWTLTEDMEFEVFGKVLRAWKGENY